MARALSICTAFCTVLLLVPSSARAQEYVARSLGVADGLANERVNCLMQDRKGYLWIGTWEGLSRFDGAEFATIDANDGMPNEYASALAEDETGSVWIATHGAGIARFLDEPAERAAAGGRRVECFQVASTRESNIVDEIVCLPGGIVLCATQGGLFRGTLDAQKKPSFERLLEGATLAWASSTARDGDGGVWFGDKNGLIEVRGRELRRHPAPESAEKLPIEALALGRDGGLFVATSNVLFTCSKTTGNELVWSALPLGLTVGRDIHALCVGADGSLWIGTGGGLVRRKSDGSLEVRERDTPVYALCNDREGDLWAGTWSRGAIVLSPSRVRSWTTADGLPDRNVARMVSAGPGRMLASTVRGMALIDHGRLLAIESSLRPEFSNIAMRVVRDHRGIWWFGTDHGIYHSAEAVLDPGRATALPRARGVFGRMLETTSDRIVFGAIDGGAYSFDARAGAVAEIEKLATDATPWTDQLREFLSDRQGALWLATYVDLFRVRAGHAAKIELAHAAVEMQPRCFLEDNRGSLWVGTRAAGVWRSDDPSAQAPVFEHLGKPDGLPSESVWSIAADASGALWFATGRGLARLDPANGKVTNITSFDGLAGDIVSHCVVDEEQVLWAATSGGVSAIDTNASLPAPAPPPVYVVRVRAGGVERHLAETGVVSVAPIELAANQSDVAIELASPSFQSARRVRYQHRLGGEEEAWSAPSTLRTIELPRLAPGHYRFEARALNGDVASVEPVRVEIEVLPHFWQRAWFLALCALGAAGAGYLVQRAKSRRVLALERIRSQIATDLHDELGSGLAQIAILSEVARRDSSLASRPHLESVAALARSLRESVGEIVWAIDPRKDQAGELLRRMRAVAFNLLESEGIGVLFHAPDERTLESTGLAPDQRRHLLLVLKEALTNVARHAHATHVEVDLRVERGELLLAIRDDGRGFDTTQDSAGHGLASLRRRAQALRAKFTLHSTPGTGTTLELALPLG